MDLLSLISEDWSLFYDSQCSYNVFVSASIQWILHGSLILVDAILPTLWLFFRTGGRFKKKLKNIYNGYGENLATIIVFKYL